LDAAAKICEIPPLMNANRWFFLLLVPLAWGGCSLVHFRHPGDEYAMYFISSLAGSWFCFFIQIGDIHQWWIPWSIAMMGAGVMAGAGWALVRLGAQRWLWVALFGTSAAVVLALSLSQFPSLERTVAKNGSLLAYGCSAALLGSSVASVLSLGMAPLVRWYARRRSSPQ
jgi:hypothetical protein